jgi:hypothetical protein
MRAAALVLVLAGCGRVGFDDVAARANADAGPDAAPGSYAAAVLASTPYAYFRLDETSGTVAHDSSGGSNDAPYNVDFGALTLGVPGALVAPDLGLHVEADGNTGPNLAAYVQLPADGASWASDFTIEAFVRPTALTTQTYGASLLVCEHYQHDGFRSGWTIDLKPEIWTDEAGETGQLGHVTGTSTLTVGTWAHLAYVRSGSGAAIYQDGVMVASGSLAMMEPDAQSDCGFGGLHGDPSYADFDEVALYKRALSADEIATHFAAR